MKLLTFHTSQGDEHVGVLTDRGVLDVERWVAALSVPGAPSGGMLRLLKAGRRALAALDAHISACEPDEIIPLAELSVAAPVPRPGKIIGVGRNYAEHARETGVQASAEPRLFGKFPSSVIASGEPVVRPASITKLDFEAELAVIIGKAARNVAEAKALDHVAGYTLLNDISAREYQFDKGLPQTTFAKSMDGFTPMGPWIVTADEVPDPQALEIASWLNGAEMQRASTADMIFSVAALIAYISGLMTLEPGDVIATGTPAGVGHFRDPPIHLQPGDRFRMEISGIGAMEHAIVGAI